MLFNPLFCGIPFNSREPHLSSLETWVFVDYLLSPLALQLSDLSVSNVNDLPLNSGSINRDLYSQKTIDLCISYQNSAI